MSHWNACTYQHYFSLENPNRKSLRNMSVRLFFQNFQWYLWKGKTSSRAVETNCSVVLWPEICTRGLFLCIWNVNVSVSKGIYERLLKVGFYLESICVWGRLCRSSESPMEQIKSIHALTYYWFMGFCCSQMSVHKASAPASQSTSFLWSTIKLCTFIRPSSLAMLPPACPAIVTGIII